MLPFWSSLYFFRFVHITTRVTDSLAPASLPPLAKSSMSACTLCRETVSLALRVRENTLLTNKHWNFSKDSVRKIFKTFTRSIGINSSSLVNKRSQLLHQVISYFYKKVLHCFSSHELKTVFYIIYLKWFFTLVLPEVRITHQQPSREPSQNKPQSPTKSASPSKPLTDAERNEICLFFIRRHCSFKGIWCISSAALWVFTVVTFWTVTSCGFCHRELQPRPLASALQMAGFRPGRCDLEGLGQHGGSWESILWSVMWDELQRSTKTYVSIYEHFQFSKVK